MGWNRLRVFRRPRCEALPKKCTGSVPHGTVFLTLRKATPAFLCSDGLGRVQGRRPGLRVRSEVRAGQRLGRGAPGVLLLRGPLCWPERSLPVIHGLCNHFRPERRLFFFSFFLINRRVPLRCIKRCLCGRESQSACCPFLGTSGKVSVVMCLPILGVWGGGGGGEGVIRMFPVSHLLSTWGNSKG